MLDAAASSNAPIAWNSSSAIASRRPRSVGNAPGQREHLLGQPRDVALGPRRWESDGEPTLPARSGSTRTSGRSAVEQIAQPGAYARSSRVSTDDERPRVALEERDVRAVAADRDLDRQRAALRGGARAPDARATTCRSGAARSGRSSGRPAGRRSSRSSSTSRSTNADGRDHLAVDERILHATSDYVMTTYD